MKRKLKILSLALLLSIGSIGVYATCTESATDNPGKCNGGGCERTNETGTACNGNTCAGCT
ncbi:hypothetical protein [Daejeonella lutea]|uniref:Natural product n=1 Tax=Daejeonella lutea TaxID=572036 RepID=A0A1T5B235_9SPHI|nr:hypothetical protein [Daejeonella lutea]SKB41159.1 hypothetical protein SAMN05661099_1207 [Daejeonella lutea]